MIIETKNIKVVSLDLMHLEKVSKLLDAMLMEAEIKEERNFFALLAEVALLLENKRVFDTTIQIKRKETIEEAIRFLGESFIERFEAIRKDLKDNDERLFIHGTADTVTACQILESGLYYYDPNIAATTYEAEVVPNADDYPGLLNWPHKNYHQLVLVAIPKGCYHFWEKLSDTSSYCYRIPKEFIRGYLDMQEARVFENPSFDRNRVCSNLLLDKKLKDGVISKETRSVFSVESSKSPVQTACHNIQRLLHSFVYDVVSIEQYPSIVNEIKDNFTTISTTLGDVESVQGAYSKSKT